MFSSTVLRLLAHVKTTTQMIKGVRLGGMGKALSFLDTLVIPIIENTPDEEDLKDSMAAAMVEYPDAAAVLVRRHGVYVWGADWEKAKTQTEVGISYVRSAGDLI
jgi:methylthioribulose-1-phosphate dehydratase